MIRKFLKALRLAQTRSYWRGLRNGVGAAIEHEPFLRGRSFRTILDVGANKGQFALVAWECVPAAKIVSFEPLETPRLHFRAVFGRDPRVQLIDLALGASDTELAMHVSRKIDSSSLLSFSPQLARSFPGTEELAKQPVKVKRLDGIFSDLGAERPVLLKLDVQGFELEALRGAERAFDRIDDIYAELSFVRLYEEQPLAHEIIAWLAARGFVLGGVYQISFDAAGRMVQADCHFRRTGTDI